MTDHGIKIGLYRHFKGNMYVVLDTAIHSENKELMVIYKPLVGRSLWTRPANMFFDDVSDRKDNTTGQNTRFELVKDFGPSGGIA